MRASLRPNKASANVLGVRASGAAGSARGFYPSLHLNLADVYQRLGEPDLALEHVQRGKAAVASLPDDGYGTMIRDALTRIEGALTDTRRPQTEQPDR